MNLEEQILKEHSKANTDSIVAYIADDAHKFGQLMRLFFHGSHRLAQRAAWPMSICAIAHPQLILPYLPQLVSRLREKDSHPAVKRNILRILQFIEMPEAYQGKLLDTCFEILLNKEPVAIKAFAMTVTYNIGRHEPDLMNELRIIIEDQMPYTSPAFQSRGSKILKALEKHA